MKSTAPGNGSRHIFIDVLLCLALIGLLSGCGWLSPSGQSTNTYRWPGATPVISADGSRNAIVWALETNGSGAPAVLHAYSATDVSIELYSSNQNPARDNAGSAVKFAVPTVADGKVYVGSQDQVTVFGLLP